MRALVKRPLLLVLAVLILLDIVIIQTVLSGDDNGPATQREALATRTPPSVMPRGVTPVAVAPGDTPSPTPTASPEPPTPKATATPTPKATRTPRETPTPKATPTPKESPTPKDPAPDENPPGSTDGSESAIQVKGEEFAAGPFETVSMAGTYVGSRARTILRIQQQQGADWVDFPLPTTTDESGNFTVHVELASPGEHQIRIVDPKSDAVSQPVTVVIR